MTENTTFHDECHMRTRCARYDTCPMVTFHRIISGKWKILILWYLSNKTLRFSDLQRKLPDVTQKTLTTQLRNLEKDKLIIRTIYPTVPPKVEYSLSDVGKDMIPLLEAMYTYGVGYLEKTND